MVLENAEMSTNVAEDPLIPLVTDVLPWTIRRHPQRVLLLRDRYLGLYLSVRNRQPSRSFRPTFFVSMTEDPGLVQVGLRDLDD